MTQPISFAHLDLIEQGELERMMDSVGAKALSAIMRRFAQSSTTQAGRIAGFIESGDHGAACAEARSLKGAAAVVGASRLEAIAAVIEAAPDTAGRNEIWELQGIVAETKAWIEANLQPTNPD
ncbi:Hpt domain-containing protein [Aurantiacibacter sp. MUD11]|uniref:Hpt domain-containing protein n=1 Tax=Aurantiacibacter sp. MUD11 TaxID=3003265 RepID=UPI0022AA8B14|nr:Hpt domain-containing protein [Aurantiacibacter sp. MUD11]WAT18345.1 Hpt domain-containing protein [Aurantiacibacter sp. MUD11]